MTTTTQAAACKPWCNDHVLIDPNTGEPDPNGGWCRHVRGGLVVEDCPDGRLVVETDYKASTPVLLENLQLDDAERLAGELVALAADIIRAVSDVRATLESAA